MAAARPKPEGICGNKLSISGGLCFIKIVDTLEVCDAAYFGINPIPRKYRAHIVNIDINTFSLSLTRCQTSDLLNASVFFLF